MKPFSIYIFTVIFLLLSCKPKDSAGTVQQKSVDSTVQIPRFNADSAYQYIQNQVNFGPRVPNTSAHTACADYFHKEFIRLRANSVVVQQANVVNYAGKTLHAKNIIASYGPPGSNRILLFAHWDTRPYADHDINPANHQSPIDGANDGASGCGVLLEIARQLNQQMPSIGVDIILFDAEDWGVPSFNRENHAENGYCLGSDYWAKNPHVEGYTAKYGILLDMVGAPDAVFYKEIYSKQYASRILNKVWETAQALGYGKYFINANGGMIEDDHVQVIEHLNIPCIDIIHFDPNTSKGFGSYWHTLNDTMDNINRETLQAVGQTLLHVIYNEK